MCMLASTLHKKRGQASLTLMLAVMSASVESPMSPLKPFSSHNLEKRAADFPGAYQKAKDYGKVTGSGKGHRKWQRSPEVGNSRGLL